MDIQESLKYYKFLFAMTPFAISTLVLGSDGNLKEKENETLKQSAALVEPTRSNLEGALSTIELKKELSPEDQKILLTTVKARFESNMGRHKNIEWSKVQTKLEASPEKMWSLSEMERTGGEPDVVAYDEKTNEYIFNDCSKESPSGRRNICYDRAGQYMVEKNGNKTNGNAIDMAKVMGIEILTEEQYRYLQTLDRFDENTWSWIKTPDDVRESGCALFGGRVIVNVRVYQFYVFSHDDYRAFRGSLRV